MLAQIAIAWKLVSQMEYCDYRSQVFWKCVYDLRAAGTIVNPVLFLEKIAKHQK